MMRLAIEAALRRGLEYDVLVIVGGVSVGARDLVKPALASVGAQTDLWRVSVKPGKPFLFGRAGQCAIFGLPGNPVSAFMTFLLFVRPAILRMMGAERNRAFSAELRSAADRGSAKQGRPSPLRARPGGGGKIHAGRPPGIACALWVEPRECASAGSAERDIPERAHRSGSHSRLIVAFVAARV